MTEAEEWIDLHGLLERGEIDEKHAALMVSYIALQQVMIEQLQNALRPFAEHATTDPAGEGCGISVTHLMEARKVYDLINNLPKPPAATER